MLLYRKFTFTVGRLIMVCHCLLQPGNTVFLLRPRGGLQLSAVIEDGQIQARFRSSEVETARLFWR
jgi:hypothetical protein